MPAYILVFIVTGLLSQCQFNRSEIQKTSESLCITAIILHFMTVGINVITQECE